MRKVTSVFFCSVLIALNAFAQEPMTDLYQYNYTSISPAFAGLDGQKITMMGSYLQTKNKTQISSGFASYEVNANKINSGFALTLNHDALGPQSRSFINLLYNYQFKINDKSKFVLGAKFTDYVLMVDFSQYIPLDLIDPVIGATEPQTAKTLMFGLGALYKHDRFFVGVSTDNLATKTIKEINFLNVDDDDKLLHYTAGVNFKIANWLSSTHSVYGLTVGNYWRADLNNTFTFADLIMLGVSVEKNEANDDIIPKINAGIKLKDRGQIVLLYSDEETIPNKFKLQAMLQFKL